MIHQVEKHEECNTKNPFNILVFPLIMAALCAIMYCIAFHQERDKNEILTKKLSKYETNTK